MKTVVFMSAVGDVPSQIHLQDGTTLRPIISGGSPVPVNTFAIPLAFREHMLRAGLEMDDFLNRDVVQGPTSARPTSPASGDMFWDQSIAALLIWSAGQNAWTSVTAWTA